MKESDKGGTCSTRGRNTYNMLVIKLRLRDHLEGPVMDERIILKRILKRIAQFDLDSSGSR